MQTVDLRSRLDARDPVVLALLAQCVYPDPIRLEQVAARYQSEKWTLLGITEDDGLLGLIGLNEGNTLEAVTETGASKNEVVIITHIAVQPMVQGRGLGRKLLQLATVRGARTLYAETDAEAKDFYQACGFVISSLGELYPGVERFGCCLQV